MLQFMLDRCVHLRIECEEESILAKSKEQNRLAVENVRLTFFFATDLLTARMSRSGC